jgi:large subunit ribosomal protein L13
MDQKTSVLKGNNVDRKWHLIDLEGKTLGRICTEIAPLLMGKNKVTFSYHRDDGNYVVAINASKIVVTGKKLKDKIYYWHTAWSGHLKSLTLQEMMRKDPRRVIELGVKNMLPKNHLRDVRMTRLKIFVSSEHKYNDKFQK